MRRIKEWLAITKPCLALEGNVEIFEALLCSTLEKVLSSL